MAGIQAIHQIEYRWQQARDMSPVATSLPSEGYQAWIQRIGAWVRHPGVDAPTGSVRYEMFGDQLAALAWRQRGRLAVGFADGRPLASRVLVGPADLLNPGVAMTVCYAGLSTDMIGPPPGAVAPGDPLPTVDPGWLTKLAQDNTEALDREAAREPGLDRVAAVALSDVDTPLSVELPERHITRSPWGGTQAVLLWGLWTTISPLLGDGGRRGWSFSTFELPLNDMDPATLPDIVFRLAQPAPQTAPMTMRPEMRVRPQEPVAVPADTLPQHLARLLVIAYQDHGGEEFTQLITSYAGDHKTTDRRIRAVHAALQARFSPVVSQEPKKPENRADSPAPAASKPADQERRPEPARQPSASTVPTAPAPLPEATRARPVPPVVLPPGGKPVVSLSKSPHDAPGYPGGNQSRLSEETHQPATLSAVLARLSAGPAAEGFESALRALQARSFDSGPPERAEARKLITRHRWYLDAVKQYDQAEREAILVAIFSCSVVPDLRDERVLAEITHWAGALAAPVPVINALYQATDRMVGAQPLMSRALEPALAQRWRDEHGIVVPAGIPLPSQDRVPGHRNQGTGPQHVAVPQELQPSDVRPAPQPEAPSQKSAHAPNEPQAWWPGLLEGSWNVPRVLVLAVCIAFIVLLFIR